MIKTINCAHRGASGHAPENTIAALEKAIALGAVMAEIDIQQTADDRFAVFHDDLLNRTTNGTGPLWERTLHELQALDAGSWFGSEFAAQRIPSLEEILDLTRGRLPLNIELKLHGHERDVVDLVIRTLHDNNIEDHCPVRGLVTCFDHRIAAEIKQADATLIVGAILGKQQFSPGIFAAPVDVLSAEKSLVDEDFMAAARGAGKQVHVWTVNDPEEMHRLIDLGVDAVITNYPDRFPDPQKGTA
ncbi:MAG: glycerophosphodiester phosphodiesterase family protein [Candidatus Krumholzibacteriota bacterium]